MSESPKPAYGFEFIPIATQLQASLEALRTLVGRIGPYADEHDRGTRETFFAALAAIVPRVKELLAAEQPSPELLAAVNADIDAVANDQQNAKALTDALQSLRRSAPVQGDLIRQGALVTLASHFESLVAELIHLYYERFPKALSEERTLTLAELRQFGSIRDGEKFLVGKEVDAVLRGNVSDQLAYFRKPLKVELAALDSLLDRLVEIAQRRNVYVHNRGIANKQYLQGVSKELLEQFKVVEGQLLPLSNEYIQQAIDTTEVSAMGLLQSCWRKWEQQHEDADGQLLHWLYESLRHERYSLIDSSARIVGSMKFVKAEHRRIGVVNHAIALRELGRPDEVASVMSREDWSGAGLQFLVADGVLKMDVERVKKLLPRAIAAEQITQENLEEWPLFKPFRKQEWFVSLLSARRPESAPSSSRNSEKRATSRVSRSKRSSPPREPARKLAHSSPPRVTQRSTSSARKSDRSD